VNTQSDEELQGCKVCCDGASDDLNQILFCDGCNVAIHQRCYGVHLIPEGEWFCQRCELLGHRLGSFPETKFVSPFAPSSDVLTLKFMSESGEAVRCLFCGQKGGAMKLSTRNEWIHVQCALWLPETGFEGAHPA
jgi:NuA3 HAT complex component NTO1